MIRYALLGLLRERSDYGYRLLRRFEQRLGKTWQLNVGQVYQTIYSMQREGLVEELACSDSDDRYPARRPFAITEKGNRVLERWLRRPPTWVQPIRNEVLIRLLLLDRERTRDALANIVDQERLYRLRLSGIEAERRSLADGADEALFVRDAALQAAWLDVGARLQWLEYLRQRLEPAGEEPQSMVS